MSKVVEFIYQETEVHFLVNPTDKNVMINATEMAKMFRKRTDHYLQNEVTKLFIKELKVPDMSGTLTSKIIDNRGRNGIYFCELLALDFAAWLDVKFKIWIYKTIRNLLTKETKVVKTAVNTLSEKEIALKLMVSKIKNGESEEAKLLLNAFSEYEDAKKNKTKAVKIFSKQMSMNF